MNDERSDFASNPRSADAGRQTSESRTTLERCSRSLTAIALAAALAIPTIAQEKQVDLTNKSLEDLMNVEVTSVSKREQKLSQTAAAIFVISQEDIRRSGATNIPDVLRMVPGLQVAQINSDTWAITARGFNGQYSNDLLVLIDGRTIYSPIFAGVYWDAQNILLENIECIEVIRGPGATIWGANAVNGVINIITKNSKDTQGGLLTGGGGTYERGFGTVRYGGQVGNDTTYRANVLGFNRDHFPSPSGQNGEDSWHAFSGGFRVDSKIGDKDSLTFEGDAVSGSAGELAGVASLSPPQNEVLTLQDHFSGWDLVSRWDHSFSPRSQTALRVYFDRSNRGDTTYGTGLAAFDIDFQHHLPWGDHQNLVWGFGYRANWDDTTPGFRVSLDPRDQTTRIFNSFVQDDRDPAGPFVSHGGDEARAQHLHGIWLATQRSRRLDDQ
jgi:iron complex outermembrane recepter protein